MGTVKFFCFCLWLRSKHLCLPETADPRPQAAFQCVSLDVGEREPPYLQHGSRIARLGWFVAAIQVPEASCHGSKMHA